MERFFVIDVTKSQNHDFVGQVIPHLADCRNDRAVFILG